jgi:type IV secretory pathway VirB3-like protein
MVVPEDPHNESLRLELQEALSTYRHWVAQLTQVTGFFVAADVVLVSYGFSQRLAGILLVASGLPMLILVMYMVVGSIATPFVDLVLRIERRLLIKKDSLGATYVHTYFRSTSPTVGSRIEDLNDEEVRHLNLKWDSLWSPIPIIAYVATAGQIGLFVLSLTVFHYRFM